MPWRLYSYQFLFYTLGAYEFQICCIFRVFEFIFKASLFIVEDIILPYRNLTGLGAFVEVRNRLHSNLPL